jgi:2,4-dienoyl-CoA reductase (NADPH2)
VIANGCLGDPHDAVGVLERGEADAIGLGRPLFTDPDWPRKVADGALDVIRTCPDDPPICARTQLFGAVCDHWPPEVTRDGYFGYQA